MDNHSTIGNGAPNAGLLAGLLNGETVDSIAEKVEAARHHDREVDQLIESFIDCWPGYGPDNKPLCH